MKKLLPGIISVLLSGLLWTWLAAPAAAQEPWCENADLNFISSASGFTAGADTAWVAGQGFVGSNGHLSIHGPSSFPWLDGVTPVWYPPVDGTYTFTYYLDSSVVATRSGGFTERFNMFLNQLHVDELTIEYDGAEDPIYVRTLSFCGYSTEPPTPTPTATPSPTPTATPTPTPTATPPIAPYSIESGRYITYTVPFTCSAIPALMAGAGINTEHWRAIYNGGLPGDPPLPDAEWGAAAAYVTTAEPVMCMLLEQTRYSADIAGRMSNEFINYSSWSGRAMSNGSIWLYQGVLYSTGVIGHNANSIFFDTGSNWEITTGWLSWLWARLDNSMAVYRAGLSNSGYSGQNTLILAWNDLLIDLGATFSSILDTFIIVWNGSILPALQSVYSSPTELVVDANPGAELFGPLGDFVWWVLSFLGSLIELFWWILNFILQNIILVATLPFILTNAFIAAIASPGYTLAIVCSGSSFWCPFLAGVELVNTTVAQTIGFPVVIVGIIIATIAIFWRDIWSVFQFNIQ